MDQTNTAALKLTVTGKNDLGCNVSYVQDGKQGVGVLPRGKCPGLDLKESYVWHRAAKVDDSCDGVQISSLTKEDGTKVPVFRAVNSRQVKSGGSVVDRSEWDARYKRAMELFEDENGMINDGVVTKIAPDFSFCEVTFDGGYIRAILHCSSFGEGVSEAEQQRRLGRWLLKRKQSGKGISVEMLEPQQFPRFRQVVLPVFDDSDED